MDATIYLGFLFAFLAPIFGTLWLIDLLFAASK